MSSLPMNPLFIHAYLKVEDRCDRDIAEGVAARARPRPCAGLVLVAAARTLKHICRGGERHAGQLPVVLQTLRLVLLLLLFLLLLRLLHENGGI